MRDKRDAEHFRAVLPNFWPLKSDKERARAERAADRVNRKIKVAKVHSGAGTDMWVSVECSLPIIARCARC
jgi:hypothetical protein